MNRNNSTSKFISLILRHRLEVIRITLDKHGWASVDELLNQSEQNASSHTWKNSFPCAGD